MRKILLADDSVTAQNMGRKILTDAGYEVVTVNNGSAALKRVAESKPDLIVLDLYMPGYSGLEVCQRLKDSDDTASIPILLTVGKLEPFKPEEARRVRADAHIVKPFEASELLTAITRMEERMASMQAEITRFGSESGKKVDTSPDTGWKSRLGFPSRKKKEETEEAAPGFRDFRKGKNKSSNGDSAAAKSAPKAEPAIPDIPRDITPEELDALSAVAAKLDAPAASPDKPVAPLQNSQPKKEDNQNVATFAVEAPPSEVAAISAAPAETAQASAPAQPAAKDTTAAEEIQKQQKEESQQKVAAEAASETPSPAPSAAGSEAQTKEAQAQEVQAKAVVEIPVSQTEPSAATVPVQATESEPGPEPKSEILASQQPSQPSSIATAKPPEAVVEVKNPEVKNDEHSAVKASVVQFQVVSSTASTPEAAAFADSASNTASRAQTDSTASSQSEPPNAASDQAAAKTEKAPENLPTSASVAASSQASEPEVPAPTDEELAQALRLLTPSPAQNESGSTTPRWIAEPVALTADEAAISLEAEMFGTFAARAAASIISAEPVRLSTIVAAVENRIAASELASGASAAELSAQSSSVAAALASGSSSEATSANLAAIVAEGGSDSASLGAAVAPESKPSEAFSTGDSAQVARKDFVESAQQDTGAEVSPATFADAIAATADEATPQASQVASVETSVPVVASEQRSAEPDTVEAVSAKTGSAEANQQVTPTSEVEDSMAKNAKAKSGTNGQSSEMEQSHDVPEKANAMAASASAEGSASPAPDASAIASIVDSVMADLRPKIVEEIAKKLAGK